MRRTVIASLVASTVLVLPVSASASPQPIILQALPDGDFTIVAAALTTDVLMDTGDATNTTNIANGSGWYYSDNYSWGFVKAGDQVDRRWCDAGGLLDGWASPEARLCWHTAEGRLQAGWSVGSYRTSSSDNPPAYRAIYVSDLPSYYPYGPTPNVAQAALRISGWRLCFSSLYWNVGDGHPRDAGLGTRISDIRAACDGKYMLLAGMAGPSSFKGAPAALQMPGTGHWYQYVPGAPDWDAAHVDAQSRSFDGMTGHLVTISSQREADFVRQVSGPNNLWLGAHAVGSGESRAWTWLYGADAGRVFTRCTSNDVSSCGVTDSSYAPWSTGDPNNSSIEDFAIIANRPWGEGRWPAVIGGWGSCMATQNCAMDGYVIEYERIPTGSGLRLWASEEVVARGAQTDLWVASAANEAQVSITGGLAAKLTTDGAGFGKISLTAVKTGIQKFTATYSVKVGKKTTKYTSTTQLYVPSLSGSMFKIKQGKTGKFSLQFMPPGAAVAIALSDGRTLTSTADSAGKASFTPTFNALGAATYTASVAGVQIGTGGLTVTK